MRILLASPCRILAVALIAVWSPASSRAAFDMGRYERPPASGQSPLRRIEQPERMPDLDAACRDLSNLRAALGHSMAYLQQPSARRYFPCGDVTHERAVASLRAFAALLDSGLEGKRLAEAVRRCFDVYESVGSDGAGTVLFTGYSTPVFDGSLERTERFRYPLYRKPPDLIVEGESSLRRLADGSTTPYPSRGQMESSGMLRGLELIWLSDPFDAYTAHIEGHAYIRCAADQYYSVGYAASNGQPFRSFARDLAREQGLPFSSLNPDFLRSYFRENPRLIERYTQINPRFVFFDMRQGPAHGSLGEPIVARRTIATDKALFPRASLAFLSLDLPRDEGGEVVNRPYSGFALDQDTGDAMRSAGRCDLYMGPGEEAGRLAGRIRNEGRLYYLFLKP